jgi:hypothetical protein
MLRVLDVLNQSGHDAFRAGQQLGRVARGRREAAVAVGGEPLHEPGQPMAGRPRPLLEVEVSLLEQLHPGPDCPSGAPQDHGPAEQQIGGQRQPGREGEERQPGHGDAGTVVPGEHRDHHQADDPLAGFVNDAGGFHDHSAALSCRVD